MHPRSFVRQFAYAEGRAGETRTLGAGRRIARDEPPGRLMRKRQLGAIGQVSCLTLGGGGIGQVWGSTSREEGIATLRMAVDAGIDLIDASPGYKVCEELIGEALAAVCRTGCGSRPNAASAHRRPRTPDANERRSELETEWSIYREAVVPAMGRLTWEGLIGAWGSPASRSRSRSSPQSSMSSAPAQFRR